MNFNPPIFSKMDNPSSHIESILFRLINYNYIYLMNVFIIICPIWLSFDWSMGCISTINSFDDYRIAYVALFWIAVIVFTIKIVNKSR